VDDVTYAAVDEEAEDEVEIHLDDLLVSQFSSPFFFSGSGASVVTSGHMMAGNGGLVAGRLEPTVTSHISRRGFKFGTKSKSVEKLIEK